MKKDERILLSHGSGGKEEEELIKELFSPLIEKKIHGSVGFESFDDGSILPCPEERHICISTDHHTVKPIFFPGGNIGTLAAAGSINDTVVMGATPIAALNSIVIETGYKRKDLETILESMIGIFNSYGIEVLGGDFKTMPEGELDGLTINTTVIGKIRQEEIFLDSQAEVGDKIIISGTVGDHGATILGLQKGINVEAKNLTSDCQPVMDVMEVTKKIGGVTTAKDPTRGGVAMALNEIAEKSNVMLEIDEAAIPIKQEARALTDMLGVDLLSLTCEGQVLITVKAEKAEEIVEELHAIGRDNAQIIGSVTSGRPGYVIMETLSGGKRIVKKPTGETVPRIC